MKETNETILQELQLKLIGMQTFTQEHYNEKNYLETEKIFNELRKWIKEKQKK